MADYQTPDNTYSENEINNGVDDGSLDFKGWDQDGNAYWQDDNGNNYYQAANGGDDNGGQGDSYGGTPTNNNYTANGHNAGGTTFGDNYGGNQSNGYWGNYGQNPYANNPYGNNPYNSNPYNSNPYNSNPYSSNPYGAPTGQAGNAGPVTSSWPGSNVFPPAAPPPAPKATPPPQKMTPMLIQQAVLDNDRVQQAINAGMTIVLDRNNLVGNVPTAMSQVLVPGNENAGIYKVTFNGPLNPDGTLVDGKTVSYSYPPLPNSGQNKQVVTHERPAPVALKPFTVPSVNNSPNVTNTSKVVTLKSIVNKHNVTVSNISNLPKYKNFRFIVEPSEDIYDYAPDSGNGVNLLNEKENNIDIYFNANGIILKINPNGTGKVFVDNQKINISAKDFFDRSHMTYGEGGSTDVATNGQDPANYFAWAIENYKNLGWDGTGKRPVSEEKMKLDIWQDKDHSYRKGTIQTAGDAKSPYNIFNNARKAFDNGNQHAFDNVDAASRVFKAVLGSLTKTIIDPTRGATNWVSAGGNGDSNPTWNNKIMNRQPLVKIATSTRYFKASTIFYKFRLAEKKKAKK